MKQVSSAEELTQLRPAERVLHVILFGSRARGEGDAESDLDVLVVVDDGDWRVHDAIADESVEPWLAHGALISPVTMNRREYEQLREWRTLFYRNLEQDGIDLWIAEPVSIS